MIEMTNTNSLRMSKDKKTSKYMRLKFKQDYVHLPHRFGEFFAEIDLSNFKNKMNIYECIHFPLLSNPK